MSVRVHFPPGAHALRRRTRLWNTLQWSQCILPRPATGWTELWCVSRTKTSLSCGSPLPTTPMHNMKSQTEFYTSDLYVYITFHSFLINDCVNEAAYSELSGDVFRLQSNRGYLTDFKIPRTEDFYCKQTFGTVDPETLSKRLGHAVQRDKGNVVSCVFLRVTCSQA